MKKTTIKKEKQTKLVRKSAVASSLPRFDIQNEADPSFSLMRKIRIKKILRKLVVANSLHSGAD